jgi:hypothetical protein
VHLVGAVDDIGRGMALVATVGVGALEVVVAQVLLKVAPEGGVAGHQRAGEGGPPGLLQDGALDALHGPVGLGTTSPDEAMLGTQLAERSAKCRPT